MACLRSSVASMIDAPKRDLNRCTSSLSSGTGFGGASFGGGAGFGAAGAPAAAAGAAGFAAAGVPGSSGRSRFCRSRARQARPGAPRVLRLPQVLQVRTAWQLRPVLPAQRMQRGDPPRARLISAACQRLPLRETAEWWRPYLSDRQPFVFGFQLPDSIQQRQAARFRKPSFYFRLKILRPNAPLRAPKPGEVHSQSSAPFRNSQTYPTIKMPRKTSIVNSPYVPSEV